MMFTKNGHITEMVQRQISITPSKRVTITFIADNGENGG